MKYMNIVNGIAPKYKSEVFNRVKNTCIKKYKELSDRVKYYENLNIEYKKIMLKHPKCYDTGGYDSEIKNAKFWFEKFKADNSEILLVN